MKKLLLLFLLLLLQELSAVGVLYARRALTEDDYRPLWLTSYAVDVQVQDQLAVTQVEHIFTNETNNTLEGVFVFPLPEGAVVTDLVLWIDGVAVHATVEESDIARALYEQQVSKGLSPALLEYLGDNLFKLSVYPIKPASDPMSERKIQITYTELLPFAHHLVTYRFHNKTRDFSEKEVAQSSFSFRVFSSAELLSCQSPSHTLAINAPSLTERDMTYQESATYSDKDIIVEYQQKQESFALHHVTYQPDSLFFDSPKTFISLNGRDPYWDNSPYILFWLTPPDSITKAQALTKNLTVVADVSGSMAGERLAQLQEVLHDMVDTLRAGDRFNLILFGTTVTPWKPSMMVMDATARTECHSFISAMQAGGLTNMEGAFEQAFLDSFSDSTMNACLFITDGLPTWPASTSAASVLSKVAQVNQDSVKIYTFGIGDGVDKGFLNDLATAHRGFATMIASDDSIATTINNFMESVSYPLMTNLSFDFGTQEIYDDNRAMVTDLYAGTQGTILGRYTDAKTTTTTVVGSIKGVQKSVMASTTYPASSDANSFVPRLWASERVRDLTKQIARYGESQSLVDHVTWLGLRYGIVTPYTSFIISDSNFTKIHDPRVATAKSPTLGVKNLGAAMQFTLSIPQSATPQKMSLTLYDVRGRVVMVLAEELSLGGTYYVGLPHRQIAQGVYVAVLQVGGLSQMVRLTL